MLSLSTALLMVTLPCLAHAQDTVPPDADELKALEERVTRLETAPAKTFLSQFNPAMGLALDFALLDRDDKADFQFRAAEINLEASVDPFVKGWAIVNGSEGGVEVEEAALETTSLPWNLTVRGGRLFASFGRFPHYHGHELPVIETPNSIDTFVNGESRGEGLEVSYLFPTDFYLSATAGVFDQIGAENDRLDIAVARPFEDFTYLGRLNAGADLGDDHSLELGISEAWTPKRTMVEDATVTGSPFATATRKGTWRALTGLDLTYRYHPSSGGLYKGVVWGTEVFVNNEQRFDPATRLPTDRVRAFSGYSYAWIKLGRRWRPGLMGDLTEDLDSARKLTKTYTAFLSCDVTEYQRLRLSFSRREDNVPGTLVSNTIGLQWTGVLGYHVHGFRDR
ncbi:MAG: hypothetical protein HY924_10695 [Elusimicrobia bacterium]|nr:hypothetical protein [Elusimicrobiota bacterium]